MVCILKNKLVAREDLPGVVYKYCHSSGIFFYLKNRESWIIISNSYVTSYLSWLTLLVLFMAKIEYTINLNNAGKTIAYILLTS